MHALNAGSNSQRYCCLKALYTFGSINSASIYHITSKSLLWVLNALKQVLWMTHFNVSVNQFRYFHALLIVVSLMCIEKPNRWLCRHGRHCANSLRIIYEGVSESFWTGRLERELQMVQLSATRCSCIDIFWEYSEFFRHNPLCCFSTSIYCFYFFRYRLSSETFIYTLVL
jgi:hypothetical protein